MSSKSLHKLLKAKKRVKKLKKKMNILHNTPMKDKFIMQARLGLGVVGRQTKPKKKKSTA